MKSSWKIGLGREWGCNAQVHALISQVEQRARARHSSQLPSAHTSVLLRRLFTYPRVMSTGNSSWLSLGFFRPSLFEEPSSDFRAVLLDCESQFLNVADDETNLNSPGCMQTCTEIIVKRNEKEGIESRQESETCSGYLTQSDESIIVLKGDFAWHREVPRHESEKNTYVKSRVSRDRKEALSVKELIRIVKSNDPKNRRLVLICRMIGHPNWNSPSGDEAD